MPSELCCVRKEVAEQGDETRAALMAGQVTMEDDEAAWIHTAMSMAKLP